MGWLMEMDGDGDGMDVNEVISVFSHGSSSSSLFDRRAMVHRLPITTSAFMEYYSILHLFIYLPLLSLNSIAYYLLASSLSTHSPADPPLFWDTMSFLIQLYFESCPRLST